MLLGSGVVTTAFLVVVSVALCIGFLFLVTWVHPSSGLFEWSWFQGRSDG